MTTTLGQSEINNEEIRYSDYQRQGMGCVERFFDRYLCNFVFKFKILILIIAIIWLGISIWRVTLLKSVSYSE